MVSRALLTLLQYVGLTYMGLLKGRLYFGLDLRTLMLDYLHF